MSLGRIMRSVDDLTAIPATITAGDSYGIVLTYSDYPATSGWSLELAVAGRSVSTWTSTDEGDAHRLTLTTAETTALGAGTCSYRIRATDGTDARTVETGTLVVEADLAELAPGAATSYWETLLTSAQEALTAIMAGQGASMYMIGGRQWMFKSADECLRVIAQCEQRIARQRNGGKIPPVIVGSFRTYDKAGWV